MTEKEFIEKLRESTFESIEYLSDSQEIFNIKVIDLYKDFILITETGKFSSGYYLSELNIILCNNYLSYNIYDTIYNIFLCITEGMVSYREFKLKQKKKKEHKYE